jgi:hypothetical protein
VYLTSHNKDLHPLVTVSLDPYATCLDLKLSKIKYSDPHPGESITIDLFQMERDNGVKVVVFVPEEHGEVNPDPLKILDKCDGTRRGLVTITFEKKQKATTSHIQRDDQY